MKKYLFFLALAGCSLSISHPQPQGQAHSAIEQSLINRALDDACLNLSLSEQAISEKLEILNKKIERLEMQKGYIEARHDPSAITNRERIVAQLEKSKAEHTATAFMSKVLPVIKGQKIFIDSPKTREGFYLSEFFEKEILQTPDLSLAKEESAANVRLKIFIKQAGIDVENYKILFFYRRFKLRALVRLEINFVDIKKQELISSSEFAGKSFYQQGFYCGIGPFIETSLQGY